MFRKHPEPMSDCKLNEGPFPCSGEGHTTELDYPSPLFYFERNSYLDCLGSTWAHPVVQIRLVFIMWSSCLSFSRSRVLGLHQAWLCILLFKYEMHSLVNLGKKILIIILCVCCCCSACFVTTIQPRDSSFITVLLSHVLQSTEMKRSPNYRLGRKSCFQVLAWIWLLRHQNLAHDSNSCH